MNYRTEPWVKLPPLPGTMAGLYYGSHLYPLLLKRAAAGHGHIPLRPDRPAHRQLLNQLGGHARTDGAVVERGLRECVEGLAVDLQPDGLTIRGWAKTQAKERGKRTHDRFRCLYIHEPASFAELPIEARGFAALFLLAADDVTGRYRMRQGETSWGKALALFFRWWFDQDNRAVRRHDYVGRSVRALLGHGYLAEGVDRDGRPYLEATSWQRAQWRLLASTLVEEEGPADGQPATTSIPPRDHLVTTSRPPGDHLGATLIPVGCHLDATSLPPGDHALRVNSVESFNTPINDPIRSDPIRMDPIRKAEPGTVPPAQVPQKTLPGMGIGPGPEAAKRGNGTGGKRTRKGHSAPPEAYPPWFERMWAAYPGRNGVKGSKSDAYAEAVQQAQAVGGGEALADLVCHALRWQRELTEWQRTVGPPIPDFVRYLRERRWTDEKPDNPAAFLPAQVMAAPPWKREEAARYALERKRKDAELEQQALGGISAEERAARKAKRMAAEAAEKARLREETARIEAQVRERALVATDWVNEATWDQPYPDIPRGHPDRPIWDDVIRQRETEMWRHGMPRWDVQGADGDKSLAMAPRWVRDFRSRVGRSPPPAPPATPPPEAPPDFGPAGARALIAQLADRATADPADRRPAAEVLLRAANVR